MTLSSWTADAAEKKVIDPSKPMIALTFDDGPHKKYTAEILDILERNHAFAAFFEVGDRVEKCPEVVLRAYRMGCEIGAHSYDHARLAGMEDRDVLSNLAKADNAFSAAGVPVPTLFRPPYGELSPAILNSTGKSIVTWSVDTEDWRFRDARVVTDTVKNRGNLDGQVVLLHSLYNSTVDAVREIVPWLQEQGYQLVTVTELLTYHYGEPPRPNMLYDPIYFTKGKLIARLVRLYKRLKPW